MSIADMQDKDDHASAQIDVAALVRWDSETPGEEDRLPQIVIVAWHSTQNNMTPIAH